MKENNPIVSLILPVYNRENTIIPCVESILNSEFSKFEILLIEDGSIDSTRKKCEKLVTKDNRVRLFCKKNEGVSVARNIGLFYGRGEWVTFVDSDDVILPCHLNVLNTLYDDSIDLIMTDYASGTIVDSRIEPQGTIGSLQNAVIASTAAVYLFNDFLPFKNPVYPIWNKFFRKRIIQDNKIMFDTTSSLGEDQIFLCHYLQYAKGIVHYRIKSYVNVSWSNLVHLGSKLRTPSDYLHRSDLNLFPILNKRF